MLTDKAHIDYVGLTAFRSLRRHVTASVATTAKPAARPLNFALPGKMQASLARIATLASPGATPAASVSHLHAAYAENAGFIVDSYVKTSNPVGTHRIESHFTGSPEALRDMALGELAANSMISDKGLLRAVAAGTAKVQLARDVPGLNWVPEVFRYAIVNDGRMSGGLGGRPLPGDEILTHRAPRTLPMAPDGRETIVDWRGIGLYITW